MRFVCIFVFLKGLAEAVANNGLHLWNSCVKLQHDEAVITLGTSAQPRPWVIDASHDASAQESSTRAAHGNTQGNVEDNRII